MKLVSFKLYNYALWFISSNSWWIKMSLSDCQQTSSFCLIMSSTIFSLASSCILSSLRVDSLRRSNVFLRRSNVFMKSRLFEFFWASRAASLDWALKNLGPLPSKNAAGWIISFRKEGKSSLILLKISLTDPASFIKIKISSSRWVINLYSWALI